MPDGPNPDNVNVPPFETADLRQNLAAFLDSDFFDPVINGPRKVGNFKWGVYAFFDDDDEPIYVGQTNEQLRTRIRRHLTNQRTDAVAMSVLDPFEVFEIEVWPLPQFQTVSGSWTREERRISTSLRAPGVREFCSEQQVWCNFEREGSSRAQRHCHAAPFFSRQNCFT